ncbi:hypothetical protein [Micromonospora tulbaghiae]|uniref:hypothetical protein n=1 Tax=Micromonospora tulbaghiae TaxID=479978 RepID=UPI003446FE02
MDETTTFQFFDYCGTNAFDLAPTEAELFHHPRIERLATDPAPILNRGVFLNELVDGLRVSGRPRHEFLLRAQVGSYSYA